MKKKIIVCIFAMCICLSACSGIEENSNLPSENQGIIRYYDIFIDPYTGVNYIIIGRGICPRYNPDGSLYVTEPQK